MGGGEFRPEWECAVPGAVGAGKFYRVDASPKSHDVTSMMRGRSRHSLDVFTVFTPTMTGFYPNLKAVVGYLYERYILG